MMRQTAIRTLLALALLALGWVAGRAQTAAPDFVLKIESPAGKTHVVCLRGCVLQSSRYASNSDSKPDFWYECGPDRCGAEVNGWLKRQ